MHGILSVYSIHALGGGGWGGSERAGASHNDSEL
jgi:hypothetical protein